MDNKLMDNKLITSNTFFLPKLKTKNNFIQQKHPIII